VALAVDHSGILYIAEVQQLGATSQGVPPYYGDIRAFDAIGKITTLAGNGQSAYNGDGLAGKLVSLAYPTDLAVDSCGNLLIADPGNDRILRLDLRGPCAQSAPLGPP